MYLLLLNIVMYFICNKKPEKFFTVLKYRFEIWDSTICRTAYISKTQGYKYFLWKEKKFSFIFISLVFPM